jgi:hypothetical protein
MLTTPSLASFSEECIFTARLDHIHKNGTAVVTILAAKKLEGSHTDCKDHIGKKQTIVLPDWDNASESKQVKIKYRHLDSLSGEGRYIEDEQWHVIKD